MVLQHFLQTNLKALVADEQIEVVSHCALRCKLCDLGEAVRQTEINSEQLFHRPIALFHCKVASKSVIDHRKRESNRKRYNESGGIMPGRDGPQPSTVII